MGARQVFRLWSWPFLFAGAVIMLVTAIGSLVVAAVLWSSDGSSPATTFRAGETYVLPSETGRMAQSLVIWAAEPEAGVDHGCEIVNERGYRRVTGPAFNTAPVVVDGQTLTWLISTSTWRPGDRVTCTGPDAPAMGPFAAGTKRFSLEIRVSAVASGVFFFGFALVLLVAGLVLRARTPSAPRPGGTGRPGPL